MGLCSGQRVMQVEERSEGRVEEMWVEEKRGG
jgi:hypothetical protein